MNYKIMGKFLSRSMFVEAVFMLPALLISIYCGEEASIFGFSCSIFLILLVAVLLGLFSKGSARSFFAKEGLVCVGVSWIMMGLMG